MGCISSTPQGDGRTTQEERLRQVEADLVSSRLAQTSKRVDSDKQASVARISSDDRQLTKQPSLTTGVLPDVLWSKEAGVTGALGNLEDTFMKESNNRTVIKQAELGSGGFGVVFRAVKKDSPDKPFALKEMKSPKPFSPGEDGSLIRTHLPLDEAVIQTILVHQNIVRTFWADICVLDPTTLQPLNTSAQSIMNGATMNEVADKLAQTYSAAAVNREPVVLQLRIAMELCDLGSIKDHLSVAGHRKRMPPLWVSLPKRPVSRELCCAMIALDIAKGLQYMHKANILHGDLKPHNILLASDSQDPKGFTTKLSDFGLASHMRTGVDHVDIQNGTIAYLPREAFQNRQATRKTDVFSFGLIMWEIWHSTFWFSVYETERQRRGVKSEGMLGFRPFCAKDCPARYVQVVEGCLRDNAGERPAFAGNRGIVKALQRLVDECIDH